MNLDKLLLALPRLAALDRAMDQISVNLASLERALRRIEEMEAPRAVPVPHNGRTPHYLGVVDKNVDHEWNRLKILSKFVNLSGKAREIELEWQRIQQDEHDEAFAHQILHGQNELAYIYKKGISEGVQWCVKRFS